ncbi:nSTAND1 domain-containing NTPase [Streptomyces litchfieldiae]|uniref:HTH cro/C1-type domain-containing protein n=1 Tax=Streptomyces litchfieldiae TaxID=3075543 RepID=A0ABU2MLG1_9ACTN|nr:helix-turn-helix domain-containing protein [Streptomyces sp. DSM 44938]MDT0342440.1 hypothetical protein [Streptomyces sp. DSM 44938]
MGRQENPLAAGDGPAQRFAAQLRELRRGAGGITYRAMAQRTPYTVSTLARAASGEQLPSLPVALAYVEACGGSRTEWEERWHRAAAEVAAEPADDEDDASPYQGLARYEPTDAERFFGREQLTADLVGLVRAHRFTAVFGPSGSGKSSLLRAGLVPALRTPEPDGDRPSAVRILTPGEHPSRERDHVLTPATGRGDGDTIVLVDQFEEVFTLCRDPAERTAFIDRLLAARADGSRLRVVIAVRADFYPRCAEHPELADAVNAASLLVGPMAGEQLRRAVVGPAQNARLIVERALTTRVVEEVAGEPGGLPLMSHALLETWRRRKGRTLSLTGYQAAGGLHGAIAHTAETAYTQLTEDQAAIARRVLLRLITPGDGTPDTRRPTHRAELGTGDPGDTELVIERLARARLITLDDNTVDLAHEALITAWPRLHTWVENDRERLRVHRGLTDDAHTWETHDRDPGLLYRGTRLTAAEEAFPPGHRDELTATEGAFLTASTALRDQEQQRAARNTRRLRALTAGLSGFLALALVATGIAFWQRQAAITAEDAAVAAQHAAQSRQLAALSGNLLDSDPELASLLAVRAYRTSPTDDAVASVYNAAALGLKGSLVGHTDPATALAFGADGTLLATAAEDGTVRLWDTATGEERHTLTVAGSVTALALGPGGDLLATATDDGTVHLRNAASGEEHHTFTLDGSVTALALSPDGDLLATATDQGTVRLWDTATGEERHTLAVAGDDTVTTLAFTPDSATLTAAGATATGTVRLWDTASGEERRTFTVDDVTVDSVALSPDGTTLATGSGGDEGTVRLWDVATGQERGAYPSHSDGVFALASGPDGTTLATSRESDAGTVLLWDMATGTEPRTFTIEGGGVESVAFSPDGTALAVVDGLRCELRDVASGELIRTFSPDGSLMYGAAFSSDGTTLATTGATYLGDEQTSDFVPEDWAGTVRLWDVATGEELRTLTADASWLGTVAFSPDGTTLAAGGGDEGMVQLWDAATGRELHTIPFGDNSADELAFSPDGTTLVTDSSGEADVVRLWDAATGEELRTYGSGDSVSAVAFSPDGTTLATDGGPDVALRLWDVATGAELRTYTGDSTSDVAFSPDGTTLAANGGYQGMVRLWDVATGAERRVLTGGDTSATGVTFSPDGTTLAAGGGDGIVRLWDAALPDVDEAVGQICDAAGREFTAEERSQYLQDLPAGAACRP